MRRSVCVAGAVAFALLSPALPASAGAILDLYGVTYPEGKKVTLPFARTDIAPKAASLVATVRMEKGQADVLISWVRMEPAVLFAGNVTSYAVWSVTRDGRPENLGELPVREKKSGEASFRTARTNFAIIVTAEVLPGTVQPSELVVFTSGKVDEKAGAKNWEFQADSTNPFQSLMRPGNPSIADMTYPAKGTEPIELQQARKAVELAEELKTETVAPKETEAAKTGLIQIQASAVEGGANKFVVTNARRVVDNAGTAIRMKLQQMFDEQVAAREAAERAAEERKRKELEATKARASAAEADKARMAGEVERLKAEQEQLRAGLQETLGRMMQVQESARGVVVNLGDILFDVGKATLKKDAEYAIVKISAILAVFPKLNARIEGFTDATGTEAVNMKLSSERARAVAEFLVSQGVAAERLTHAGYGPANPVGDNATAEGRAKNRRVELILNQGAVTATPGGTVAPDRPAKGK